MNKSVQKCRTCLKSSTNIFSVNKTATGCSPERTYGQLLKEFAKLESNADYEHLMPQYLCLLCCRELKNIHSFIKQAQYCNDKLIHVISKRLECLQEKIIVLDTTVQTAENGGQSLIKDNKSEDLNGISNIGENVEEKYSNTENFSIYLYHETMENNDDSIQKFETNTEECPKVIRCPICEKIMGTQNDLKLHMRTHHDIEKSSTLKETKKTFNCKLCPSNYSNRYSYVYHLIRKHKIDGRKRKEKYKSKIIKCRSCEYTARTYAALYYHRRSKHGSEEDRFKCKFCDFTCLKKFDLFTHIKNVHKQLIKTLKAEAENNEEIKKTVNDAKTLTISKLEPLQEDEEEQFSGEEFVRSIVNLKKRKSKSTTTSLARKCEQCGNVYRDHRALYAHQKHVHISEDKYSLCPHCGKRYKRKVDLRIHIERDHIPKNPNAPKPPAKVREKRFMCTECSYVCTTITILNIHINRKHTGVKPYKCDICFKSFIVPYDLKVHRYLHTGERPFKCPICSKGFRDNSHMVKHKRIHSSERPYKCKECGKAFALAYYLTVHNRTHLKERNLHCVTCGKVFENRSILNLHRINENHHDEVE